MVSTTARPMNLTDWLLLVTLSVLWGGSFVFNGIALRELPPFTIVTLRVGLASVILMVVITLLGLKIPRDRVTLSSFLMMGLLNNIIPFCLIVWGQTRIGSGLASILNATTPLFAVVAAHILTADERMTSNRLLGVLVGLAGVVIMIGTSTLQKLGIDVFAQCAVLIAAVSYALAGIYGRRFKARGIPPLVTATGQVTASTLILIPITLFVDQPWHLAVPSAATWGAVISIATLSTALGYFIYFRILASAGAINLMLVTFLIPVCPIILGAVFMGERLGLQHFAGMAMIGFGLAAIDGRLLNLLRRPEPA